MPAYACRARDESGTVVKKTVEAPTQHQALALLEQEGLFPTKVERKAFDVKAQLKASKRFDPIEHKREGRGRKVSRKDLVQFSMQLSAALSSGIAILAGLTSIRETCRNPRFRDALSEICADLEGGSSLSEAMGRHPEIFPRVYVGTVAAGEKSGTLDEVLDDLAEFLEAEMELRSDIRSALMYPGIVIVTLGIAITVLVIFIVPRFAAFYEGFNAELPVATKILVAGSNLLTDHAVLLVLGGAAIVLATTRVLRSPAGRARTDRVVLRIPVISSLIESAFTIRASQLLALFSQSGVSILESVRTIAVATKNTKYRGDLLAVAEGISAGQPLSACLEEVELLPVEARRMLANGESSGTLHRSCLAITKRYKKELSQLTKLMATLIEPILTLVVAVIVLFVALAAFLPMWDMVKIARG